MDNETIIIILGAVVFAAVAGGLIWYFLRSGGGKARPRDAAPARAAPTVLRSTEFPSGLKIEVLEEGSGAEAIRGHEVTVHYTGWLASGEKFDSSRDRGRPFTFKLGAGKVIMGWEEGIKGMRPGEKRRLTVPYKLGYGVSGHGPIPPKATLIFEVELIS
jgi:FKBP-type peptidyl-prolyl cis-trans isomerase